MILKQLRLNARCPHCHKDVAFAVVPALTAAEMGLEDWAARCSAVEAELSRVRTKYLNLLSERKGESRR